MKEQEYGYDIANIHLYEDETMTMEVDISKLSREDIEKVLGGVPIVRCRDCKWWEHGGWYSGWCKQYQGSVTKSEEFCARGKRKDE